MSDPRSFCLELLFGLQNNKHLCAEKWLSQAFKVVLLSHISTQPECSNMYIMLHRTKKKNKKNNDSYTPKNLYCVFKDHLAATELQVQKFAVISSQFIFLLLLLNKTTWLMWPLFGA